MKTTFGVRDPDADHTAPGRRDVRENSARDRRKQTIDSDESTLPVPQRSSNCRSSPACGVAVSRTTSRARQASAACGGPAVTARRGRMRFVQHQEIPADILQRAEGFGTLLRSPSRRDRCRAATTDSRPREARRSNVCSQAAPASTASIAKSVSELLLPLVLQRRRHEDQDPGGVAGSGHLPDDQSPLHRLPHPDIVCNEHSRGAVPEHGQCRFELIGKQSNGWRTEPETSARKGVRHHPGDLLTPSSGRDHRESRCGRAARPIERDKDVRLVPGRSLARQIERIAISERGGPEDSPVLTTHDHPVT